MAVFRVVVSTTMPEILALAVTEVRAVADTTTGGMLSAVVVLPTTELSLPAAVLGASVEGAGAPGGVVIALVGAGASVVAAAVVSGAGAAELGAGAGPAAGNSVARFGQAWAATDAASVWTGQKVCLLDRGLTTYSADRLHCTECR